MIWKEWSHPTFARKTGYRRVRMVLQKHARGVRYKVTRYRESVVVLRVHPIKQCFLFYNWKERRPWIVRILSITTCRVCYTPLYLPFLKTKDTGGLTSSHSCNLVASVILEAPLHSVFRIIDISSFWTRGWWYLRMGRWWRTWGYFRPNGSGDWAPTGHSKGLSSQLCTKFRQNTNIHSFSDYGLRVMRAESPTRDR